MTGQPAARAAENQQREGLGQSETARNPPHVHPITLLAGPFPGTHAAVEVQAEIRLNGPALLSQRLGERVVRFGQRGLEGDRLTDRGGGLGPATLPETDEAEVVV